MENLDTFVDSFYTKDWFHSIDLDKDKAVVYVNYMNKNIIESIPDRIGNHKVLVHFASSKLASIDKYKTVILTATMPSPPSKDLYVNEEDIEYLGQSEDLEFMLSELSRLEDYYGIDIVRDIFYEIHDRDNAITNKSITYPEARKDMENLYYEFGFDKLYKELDK